MTGDLFEPTQTGQNGRAPIRSVADLASTAYLLVRQPEMKVDFEIHHSSDRPGYLYHLLKQPADDSESQADAHRPFVETLSACANGIGIVIGTRRGLVRPARVRPGVDKAQQGRRHSDVFADTANPNPTFLYQATERFEAIVSLEHDLPRPMRFRDATALLELLTFVAWLAANVAKAPLLSVQFPVQLPPRSKAQDQNLRTRELPVPPHSSALALRFTIALHEPTAQKRIRLAELLREYCSTRNFGMWLGDGRPGSRPGNWFQICSRSRPGPSSDDRGEIKVCIPVTLVGPARIGSTLAIASYLRSFPDLGIAACSITKMDDLAFVSLQLVLPGLTPDRIEPLDAALAKLARRPCDAAETLRSIFEAAAAKAGVEVSAGTAPDLEKLAGDYKVFFKSAFLCLPPHSRRRMAVWFSWQTVRSPRGLSGPLVGLYEAFDRLGLWFTGGRAGGESPNLEYLICRQINGTVLRGKGKISVPKDLVDNNFGQPGLEVAAADFCSRLERQWKQCLNDNDARMISDMTVAWREFWLGH